MKGMFNRLKKKGKKGFTLVELIIVIVILAVLAAVAIPSVAGYVDRANRGRALANGRAAYMAANVVVTDLISAKAGNVASASLALSSSRASYCSDMLAIAGITDPGASILSCSIDAATGAINSNFRYSDPNSYKVFYSGGILIASK